MTALLGLRENLRLSRLHLVTDVRGGVDDFVDFVHAMYAAGVDVIQVRDARPDRGQVSDAYRAAITPAFLHRSLLCVGGDPDLAEAVQADLLQVSAAELQGARGRLRPEALIGCLVDSLDEADRAAREGADWLTVGPIAGERGLGLAAVEEMARRHPATDEKTLPWFAAGGITLDNLDDVLAAGANRVAVSTTILQASDPEAVAREFAERLREHFAALPGADDHAFRVQGGHLRTATLGDPPPVPGREGVPSTSSAASLSMPGDDIAPPSAQPQRDVPREAEGGQVSEVGALRAPREFTTEAPGE